MCYYLYGGDIIKVRTGYIYHIKDTFFDVINDNGLMINHENGQGRNLFFTDIDAIKEKMLLECN